jgi:acyl carrier protein
MEKFIEKFKETLEIEDFEISEETKFRELDEWDSLAVLSILAMINEEYDITISRKKFEKLNTIKELYTIICS